MDGCTTVLIMQPQWLRLILAGEKVPHVGCLLAVLVIWLSIAAVGPPKM